MKSYLTIIFSMALFMHLTVSINRTRVETTTYMHETQYYNMAISLAHSVIDDAALVSVDDLGDFAKRNIGLVQYDAETFDVDVELKYVYTDEKGRELTEDDDLIELAVVVTKEGTNVYVRLSQLFYDNGE